MYIRQLISFATMMGTFALLQGCASGPVVSNGEPIDSEWTYHVLTRAGDPALDHFVAWIPRDKAQTATVAQALAHVEVGKAKTQAGKEFCDGEWLISGELTDTVGPHPAMAPKEFGSYPAWYYRISHKPGLKGCSGDSRKDLYQLLRNNLPGWITVKAASPSPASPEIPVSAVSFAD